MARPTTKLSAPAAATAAMLSALMSPSTCRRSARPLASINRRACSILRRLLSRKLRDAEAGAAHDTCTTSSRSSIVGKRSSGSAGSKARPTWQPTRRMSRSVSSVRAGTPPCTVMRSAPASAKRSTSASTAGTRRCTPMGTLQCGRSCAHTMWPSIRLGRSWLSITFRCRASAPAATTRRTSSSRCTRSADRMDAAMRTMARPVSCRSARLRACPPRSCARCSAWCGR